MNNDPLRILEELISFKSLTPDSAGIFDYISSFLTKYNFQTEIKTIGDADFLYARRGSSGKNICFSGHVDVVSAGSLENWTSDPFQAIIKNDRVYGRGVCDMKGSIAAFMSVLPDISQKVESSNNSISILLTSDEERAGKTIIVEALKYLYKKSEKIDYCLIGEPTGINHVGDAVKIGRRGSVTFKLIVNGKQGHVGSPDLFENPNYAMVKILNDLNNLKLDKGNDFFVPSNLEVVSLESGSGSFNVVPSLSKAEFNIRFNNLQTFDNLEKTIKDICDKYSKNYNLDIKKGNKPFASKNRLLLDTLIPILNDMSLDPDINANGGTSDGCYISEYCDDLIEFGLSDETSHQVNENTVLDDLYKLSDIYSKLISSLSQKI